MSATRICQKDISTANGEDYAVCILPANHGGDCDFVDTMGMCIENENCRAQSDWHKPYANERDRNRPHNH